MASVTLELPEDTRRRLTEKAAQKGQPLEEFIRGVLEAEAGRSTLPPANETPVSEISIEEFERRLEALTEGLPPLQPLPEGFSRADIYDD